MAPLKIFISYASEDQVFRQELEKHLHNLKRQGLISTWHDGDILAGTEWRRQITEQLNTADIILLLISADFMASDFCYSVELTRAIARHDAHEAHVIPILLRPTYWDGAPFAKLEMLPTGAKAVIEWSSHDKAFEDVVRGIKRALSVANREPEVQVYTSTVSTNRETLTLQSAEPLRLFTDGLCAGRPLHPAPERYFVSHGFTPEKLMNWRESITETLAHANHSAQAMEPCFSGDKVQGGFRLCGIYERIYSTAFSLFLLPETQDRNVYLELGIAIGLGKPFFLIRDRNAEIPPVLTSLSLYTHSGSFRTMRRELAEQIEEYDFAAVQFTKEPTNLQTLAQYLVVAGESFDDEDFEGSIEDTIKRAYPEQQLTMFPLSQHVKRMQGFDLRQLVELIQTARFAIYRVDEQCSATTFLALGMSIGLNRPFIMISQKGEEVPFNLRGLGIYQFANYVELERDLVKWHRKTLDKYVQ